jgi:hypothetical protein
VFAADCILALFAGKDGDKEQAQIGALLIAEMMRTVRDWDFANFKRQW